MPGFPLPARWRSTRAVSPARPGETVTVTGTAPRNECDREVFVPIRRQSRPLSHLRRMPAPVRVRAALAVLLIPLLALPPRFEPVQPELLALGGSFVNAWADYDGDADLDLFVGFDGAPNRLYRNDAGRLTDVAAEAGVA